jgi:hypothetical protein
MSEVRGIGDLERRRPGGLDQELLDKMQAFIEQAKQGTSGPVDAVANSAPLMLGPVGAAPEPGDGNR